MSKNTNSTRSIDVTKGHRRMIITLASIILILSITACAKNEQKSGENETADAVATELSDAEMASLMKQVAESDVSRSYGEYLKDEAFADAEIFGVDRDGDQGTAYAYLYDGEYVVFKDKAYEMSGSAGEVIIKFTYREDDSTANVVYSKLTADYTLDGYIRHPAFYYGEYTGSEGITNENSGYIAGGVEVTGIWISKYEAGYTD